MSIASEIKKGALVNFFGVIGKIAAPAFLIVVNRLFGPDIFGLYITASITIEIIIAFLTSGFKDSALIFVARYAENKEDTSKLYNSLSNAFAWSVGFSILILIFGSIFGNVILEFAYKDEFSNGLSIMFTYMLFAIPLMAFERIVLAATQGLKIMKYDAISNGWLRPIILLVFAIIFWFYKPSIVGMALTYLCTQIVLFLMSIWVFTRELNWSKLQHGLIHLKMDKELLDFAIPQNINMTLNRFITGIDVLMLPVFGFSTTSVGFYGAGSMIIREIKAIKMVFSTAFAPHIVRLHKNLKFEELSHHFSATSGWIATLAIPILLLVAIFKHELLTIIQPQFLGESTFMYFLLPIPYLYCSLSLAGNIVAMTGHSKLTLINSLAVSIFNVIFNILFIPKFGIIGAALSSSLATFILSGLELFEARKFTNSKLYVSVIYKPHIAGLISATILIFSLNFIPWFSAGLFEKTVLATITIGLFSMSIGTDFIKTVIRKLG